MVLDRMKVGFCWDWSANGLSHPQEAEGRCRPCAAQTYLAHAPEECLARLAEHRVALRVGNERSRGKPDVLDGLGRPPGESTHGRWQGVGEVKSCGVVSAWSGKRSAEEAARNHMRTCTH